MPTRSRTLRKLPKFTRKYYRLCDELQSVCTRFKNLREELQRMELDARALFESQSHEKPSELNPQWHGQELPGVKEF
jgi:hypothetical protein